MKKVIKQFKYATPVLMAMILVGCGAQPAKPLYNYAGYSDSYYAYKKNMTPESTLQLEKSIQEAIDGTENSRSGRVAPGMHANLGYLYLKAGKPNEAIESFTKEKTVYPEATVFMDKLINRVKATEGTKK
jgi:hypothetical protein